MAQPLSTPDAAIAAPSSRGTLPTAVICAASIAGLLFAAALALWFHYGTAVFFETMTAGFAGCF
jgi:hypothetical protein